jgi:hypothetical protein
MLIIGGVKDTQVPISDIYELLSAGDVPKEAWINPSGGHLGRQVHVWPDPRILVGAWRFELQASCAQGRRIYLWEVLPFQSLF